VNLLLEKLDDHAVINVQDSGVGIENEFLPHIFDRFSQADASSRRNYTGLGLGLTIVRTIVELHNGEIRASSEGRDKGSTFTVRLPLQEEFYHADDVGIEQAETDSDSYILNGTTILLVDDDVESIQPLQLFLERQKAKVDCANSAADALAKLASSDFHVLISDIGMPKVDGYQFIELIRKTINGRNSSIPAIALTAYASEDDKRKALAAGFQTHLVKPVDFELLLETIQSVKVSD
jgi:CheY-like chemotaxis protein